MDSNYFLLIFLPLNRNVNVQDLFLRNGFCLSSYIDDVMPVVAILRGRGRRPAVDGRSRTCTSSTLLIIEIISIEKNCRVILTDTAKCFLTSLSYNSKITPCIMIVNLMISQYWISFIGDCYSIINSLLSKGLYYN